MCRKVSGGGGTFHSAPDISGGGGGGSSGQGAQGGIRGRGGAALGGGGSRDVAVGWGKKAGSLRRPVFQAVAGTAHGAKQLSPRAVPAAQAPSLPKACEAALGPGSAPVLLELGCPACPWSGAAAL